MNISTQTQKATQGHQLHHGGFFSFNCISNSVVSNMAWQTSQHIKQASNNAHFFIGNVKRITTRIRLVMHDACVLSFQAIDYSLDPESSACIEQNELYVWKREQGGISNA